MKLINEEIKVETKGNTDIMDITARVQERINKSRLKDGHIVLFVPGSTAGFTTMEYEPNLSQDMVTMFESIAPSDADYAHHMTWGDYNGHSHLKASLLGPSLTVPFVKGRLTLGTWQQIVFIDFDTSRRSRKIVLQITGLP